MTHGSDIDQKLTRRMVLCPKISSIYVTVAKRAVEEMAQYTWQGKLGSYLD